MWSLCAAIIAAMVGAFGRERTFDLLPEVWMTAS